jgi:putative ABC transport system permease protein
LGCHDRREELRTITVLDLVGLSFGALKERRLRSGLTVLMVIIGVALMTSINGLGGGMNNYISEQLGTLGANVLIVTPYSGFGPEARSGLQTKLTAQTVRTIERFSGVKYAIPFFTGGATLKSGSESRTVSILGIDQSKLTYIAPKISLESGSYVSPGDSSGMILGYGIAHPSNLDKPFANTGQTVSIEFSQIENQGGNEKLVTKTKAFQVRGVLSELGNQQTDSQISISLAEANALFAKAGTYDGIYVITNNPDQNDRVETSITKFYGKNIGVMSPKAIASTIQNLLGTFIGFLSAIAAVSMLVGAVGIITTLYTSVMERTREIGLLKAIGYARETVLFMFLTESFAIGLLGAVLGLVFGIGGAYVLIRIMPFGGGPGGMMSINPSFSPPSLLQVFLLACGLSVLAGLYPAWRASTLSPITALKKE